MARSGPRKSPNAPVMWEEVWWWSREIAKHWGYETKVSIHPPIDCVKNQRFTVLVELKRLRVDDSGKDTTITKWRGVKDQSLTAEQVALTMVVELHRQLDNEEMERERQAYAMGALL